MPTRGRYRHHRSPCDEIGNTISRISAIWPRPSHLGTSRANVSTTFGVCVHRRFHRWDYDLMARIYAASSWRNEDQPFIVEQLRRAGHEVYDFRNPPNGVGGFAWSQIDPDWQSWSARRYRELL